MATAKKKTARKAASKKSKNTSLKSFKLGQEPAPFITFRITEQTVYWSMMLILILILALWILQLQIDVSDILNNIKST